MDDAAAVCVTGHPRGIVRQFLGISMSKAEDRRAVRTRKSLHEALMALIRRKHYEAISVQDIIDAADVGRSTFYAHYTGKEDLFRSGFESLRHLLAESGSPDRHGDEPLAFSLAMFEHACAYRETYRALIGGRGGMIAIEEIKRALADAVRADPLVASDDDGTISRALRIQFVVDAFLTVLTWSIGRRPLVAPADMNAAFRQLVMYGLTARQPG